MGYEYGMEKYLIIYHLCTVNTKVPFYFMLFIHEIFNFVIEN